MSLSIICASDTPNDRIYIQGICFSQYRVHYATNGTTGGALGLPVVPWHAAGHSECQALSGQSATGEAARAHATTERRQNHRPGLRERRWVQGKGRDTTDEHALAGDGVRDVSGCRPSGPAHRDFWGTRAGRSRLLPLLAEGCGARSGPVRHMARCPRLRARCGLWLWQVLQGNAVNHGIGICKKNHRIN